VALHLFSENVRLPGPSFYSVADIHVERKQAPRGFLRLNARRPGVLGDECDSAPRWRLREPPPYAEKIDV